MGEFYNASDTDWFCPKLFDCGPRHAACPSVAGTSYGSCGVYRLLVAGDMVDNAPSDGKNFDIVDLQAKMDGIEIHEMTEDERTELYEYLAAGRTMMLGLADEFLNKGCKMNTHIRLIQSIEDKYTSALRLLEQEGIKIETEDPIPELPYSAMIPVEAKT
jgi:hypothetical protein